MDEGEIEVGPTAELTLRVSAAILVRVVFPHPRSGQPMLALERKAGAPRGPEQRGEYVAAHPFGGSSHLKQPSALLAAIPAFRFDSQRVKREGDFRILIRPQDWAAVKEFCLRHFRSPGEILEADPLRELEEEFWDALRVHLDPGQFHLRRLERMALEGHPVASHNIHAPGLPTVRVYALFEAALTDPALIGRILDVSQILSDPALVEIAAQDPRGRANSILALPLEGLLSHYLALPAEQRDEQTVFAGHRLAANVPAILPEVGAPKYERVP